MTDSPSPTAAAIVQRRHETLGCRETWVQWNAARGCLEAPAVLPERFRGRVTESRTITMRSLSAHAREVRVDYYAVLSRVHDRLAARPPLRQRDLALGGLWICDADLEATHVAGFPIDPELGRWARREDATCVRPGAPVEVWYHGTDGAFLKSIAEDNGLRESEKGLLGPGVYLATFWKAAGRYAARDAAYTLRTEEGRAAVLRCYVESERLLRRGGAFERGAVAAEPCDGSAASLSSSSDCPCPCGCGTDYADHTGTWRARGHDGYVLYPVLRRGIRRKRDGAPCYVVRNPEVCARREIVHVQSIHLVDMRTVEGPDYKPDSRTTRCL